MSSPFQPLKLSTPFVRAVATWIGLLLSAQALGQAAQMAPAAPRFAEPVDDVIAVVATVEARLALMDDVAAWKWREQRPIADPEREARVVEAMATQAADFGLDADAIRALFDLQIAWARDIQTRRFAAWRSEGFPSTQPVRSLDGELRPELDAIGARLLRSLYLASPSLEQYWDHPQVAEIRRRIVARLESRTDVDAQLRGVLLRFKPVAGNLRAIRHAKTLRIGVTGDYAPFSWEARGVLSGVDIELGSNLAEQLGVEARFVRTSWPTLMGDMQQGRFDIAAGGISVTPDRAAVATFTPAYYRDGKTPIARCGQRERFATLQAINKPSVRVIVNPGGTNERFARERLAHSQLRVHPDNKTIFDEIVAGRADVMVTDGVEAELQMRKYPELCRTSDDLFNPADKAMWLPKNADLLSFAGTWLRGELERGAVRAAFDRALAKAGSTR